ncbi:MAG TPA: polyprenyl synthetase family protein [Actinomycetota bacterium]|nr:polyprenyl synthetase family protein [Actinomycetota bacterium]
MSSDVAPGIRAIATIRGRVDEVLGERLRGWRQELAELDPSAADLVDEIERLIEAGGKRLRPAFLYWGYRAAGGVDGQEVVRAAAALELLHTFALVHDDLIDGVKERRGVPATVLAFAERAPERDPEVFGTGSAVVVGDLALVLATSLLRTSGFASDRVERAWSRFERTCLAMAAGQYLELRGLATVTMPEALAHLKGGAYTVEGPVAIGAALAGSPQEVDAILAAFARPAGEAFQLRDDLADGDAVPGVSRTTIDRLVDRAVEPLRDPRLEPEAAGALAAIVELFRTPGDPG